MPLGDLFAEEERDVLVDVKLNAALAPAAAVPCVNLRVTYADVVAGSLGRAEAVAVIARDAAAPWSPRAPGPIHSKSKQNRVA